MYLSTTKFSEHRKWQISIEQTIYLFIVTLLAKRFYLANIPVKEY